MQIQHVEIRHFHLFCGLGGGGKGFNQANPRVGNLQARFRCIGGVDIDAAAIRDFKRLTGVEGTVLDLADRDQYIAINGHEPPAGWREATPADIRRAAGNERPHCVLLSPPCKGFSGLLAESKSKTDKYQAMNRLTVRGVWLMLEAWKDDLPELIAFENVPRAMTRGRSLIDQIVALLQRYGYAVAETVHDCGKIGHLAQSRKRFLMVARQMDKVPAFLYEPDQHPLRGVGDVLGKMLLPGDLRAGPMHRVPRLQWRTWVRLAFVEPGSDWRSLNKLAIENGHLRDYLIVPADAEAWHRNVLGVTGWDQPLGTVTGNARPTTGNFSVADPRAPDGALQYQQYGVIPWSEASGAIIGVKSPGQGSFAVSDPRHQGPTKHSNEFRIVQWDRSAQAVTSAHGSGQGVADPRPDWDGRHGHLHVSGWDHTSRTVTAGGKGVQGGYLSVADPRPGMERSRGDAYLTGGHYGVVGWDQPAGAVASAACHDNGPWSVADVRLPAIDDKLVAVIRSLDGTWHRPFTTLELAALQSLVDPEQHLIDADKAAWLAARDGAAVFQLDGSSDSAWRERIGNAIPSDAAEAIGHVMGTTLLLVWTGETFTLSSQPIWVKPLAVAMSVKQPDLRGH